MNEQKHIVKFFFKFIIKTITGGKEMTGYQKRLKELEVYKKEIDILVNLLFGNDKEKIRIYYKQLRRKLWEATDEEAKN